jgi:hypothetical protein
MNDIQFLPRMRVIGRSTFWRYSARTCFPVGRFFYPPADVGVPLNDDLNILGLAACYSGVTRVSLRAVPERPRTLQSP